jgi:replication factor C subunit 3/5
MSAAIDKSLVKTDVSSVKVDKSLVKTDVSSVKVDVSSVKVDKSLPWVEKYRPNQFDDIVLDPLNREFFRNVIQKDHFPNLLFYGPPGTGKTTTIINLIQEYQAKYTRVNKETVIHLNASDERGVDIIRTQIHQFVRSCHIFESGCKFVILDEVDYMTKNAQQALKTLLQTSQHNVRFCLICNYISKIDESLQREFICVRFNQLPPTEIRKFIRRIVDAENLSIDADDIDLLMASHHSDIRSMINFMQSSYFGKTIAYKQISSHEWSELSQLVTGSAFDLRDSLRGASQISPANPRTSAISCPAFFAKYIEKLSTLHNLNKKQILLKYMDHILRKHSNLICPELISVFEKVAHSSDDMPCDDLVNYFVTNLPRH